MEQSDEEHADRERGAAGHGRGGEVGGEECEDAEDNARPPRHEVGDRAGAERGRVALLGDALVMLYAPRDRAELEVAKRVLRASWRQAGGSSDA